MNWNNKEQDEFNFLKKSRQSLASKLGINSGKAKNGCLVYGGFMGVLLALNVLVIYHDSQQNMPYMTHCNFQEGKLILLSKNGNKTSTIEDIKKPQQQATPFTAEQMRQQYIGLQANTPTNHRAKVVLSSADLAQVEAAMKMSEAEKDKLRQQAVSFANALNQLSQAKPEAAIE